MALAKLLKVPEHAKNVLISMNPRSGSTNRMNLVQDLQTALRRRGYDAEVLADIAELKSRSGQLLQSGQLRTVVSAGGDGTASLLVNELDESVPLTIFPMGTANLLAKHVDAALDVDKTADTITAGWMTRMDVGMANDRVFLVVASCGFDADVVDRIHSGRKGHITYLSYGVPMINSIMKYSYPKMRLTADGQELDPASWAFVLNVPKYALGLQFVKGASGADGKLDVCTFRGGGFFRGLYYFFCVVFRRHHSMSATQFSRFSELTIESGQKIPYELDGDPGGYLPLKIRVVPDRMAILVPEGWQEAGRGF